MGEQFSWQVCRWAELGLVGLVVFGSFASADETIGAADSPPVTDTAPPSDNIGEIIVTARKRSESLLAVPVAISAFTREQLSNYDTQDLVGLSSQVPGLLIQPIPSAGGGVVALRGISSSANNPSIEQSVSLNVDGVQISSANLMRLAQIDMQNIEVLKGPQALFFGKNSPAGVISMRTEDPGSQADFEAQTSYEAYAQEEDVTLIGGGPVTDTLGVRAVAYAEHMLGYFHNEAEATPPYSLGAVNKWGPEQQEFYFRITALYQPLENLSARLKFGYADLYGDGDPEQTAERIYCPYGAPQLLGYPRGNQSCGVGDVLYSGKLNPAILSQAEPPGVLGSNGTVSRSRLGSLEINYQAVPALTLTSLTGYYTQVDDASVNVSYQSGTPASAGYTSDRREISEEFRAVTNREDWPVNLTGGSYFQNTRFSNGIAVAIDLYALGITPAPDLAVLPEDNNFTVDGDTYSFFGQAIWKITDTLELAGGARWSHETKDFTGANLTGALTPLVTHLRFVSTSPEATLTYRPTPHFTIFAAFRNGFTSGGFNTGTTPTSLTGTRIDYQPETARGFETGIKAVEGPISADLTAYSYLYKELQLSTFDPATLAQQVINAGSARVEGVETDVSWKTPIDGLTLRASGDYNRARYSRFLDDCYTGQTIDEGCNANAIAGAYTEQNLSGRPLILAPQVTGSAGFSFAQAIGNLKASLSSDVNFSSNFFAQLEETPAVRQGGFAMIDAAVHVGRPDDRWELALIGRNLSDVYRSRYVSQVPLTGNPALTGTATPGGVSDYSGQINRGREARIQLKVKFK